MTYTKKFEDHIEYELVESGYRSEKQNSTIKTLFDTQDLLGFIMDTQPKQYEKLETQYGPQTGKTP